MLWLKLAADRYTCMIKVLKFGLETINVGLEELIVERITGKSWQKSWILLPQLKRDTA